MQQIYEVIERITGKPAEEVLGVGFLFLMVISIFVEITPIKVNPITFLIELPGKIIGWLSKTINAPVLAELAKQEKTMGEIRDVVDDNEIDRIRWEILDFANSCRQHKKHTLDEFVHIIELNTKYHAILDRRKLKNGRIDLEYAYIEKIYQECLEENSFL